MWIRRRQLYESTDQNGEMDGFLLRLQNELKEAVVKEEPSLHIYPSKDVDMWVVYLIAVSLFCY